MANEIERAGIPVALITAMTMVGKQMGVNRIVTGAKIIHPCGDPSLPPKDDQTLRREIVNTALNAIQTDMKGTTVFLPNVSYTSG